MGKAFPYFKQLDLMDCGPTCLRMMAKYYGRHYTAQTMREKAQINRDGASMLGIADAAEEIGFKTVGVRLTLDRLVDEAPLPCIIHWGQDHFVVLYSVKHKFSQLNRQLLGRIWGGRKPTYEVDSPAVQNSFRKEDPVSRNPVNGVEDSRYENTIFYVADPARGLLEYSASEFKRKWLSGNTEGHREGLALLMEPGSKFYEAAGERTNALKIGGIVKYLWRFRKLVLQLCLGMVVSSALALVFPFLTQSLVDVGIETQNLSFIYLILIAQLALMLSTASVDFLRSWILLHISTRLNLTILSEFLAKLMRLPLSFFDVKQFGDIMQRIGDHHRVETFLTGQTLNVIFSTINLAVFGVILAYYHLTIFIVALAASGLYVIWVLLFLKKRGKLDSKRFEISAAGQSQIVQLIQGMQDIKISGSEIAKRWEWERIQAELFKWSVKNLSISQFQQSGAILINQSKNIFITFLAAKAVIDGQLTLGGMISIQYILAQFNAPIELMITFLQSWQDAKMSIERLNEVHNVEDEEPYSATGRKNWPEKVDIVIDNLSYTYPGAGNEPVLRNINLTIPYGKTTAIVGTSGSGKTTLLKMLLRYYEPKTGTIALSPSEDAGRHGLRYEIETGASTIKRSTIDIKNISHKAWRLQCGVVMQDGFIYSDSIARNIAVTDEIIDQDRLYEASRIANIHEFIESLPLGYYTKIGAEGNGISQGQKQRILIARSIYKKPQLLLFDEATNALDAFNEAVISRNLDSVFKDKTAVVVAHRLSTVKNADQIVVMETGSIVEIGTHDELVAARGRYYELVSNQLELAHS